MRWQSKMLGLVKKYGAPAKFAASIILNSVIPGSPAVITLVEQAFDSAQKSAQDVWEIDLSKQVQTTAENQDRLEQMLDILGWDMQHLFAQVASLEKWPEAARQMVEVSQKSDARLKEAVSKLDEVAHHFRKIHRKLIEIERKVQATFLARVCWNSNDWKKPSGGDKSKQGKFVADNKFGFDEWLKSPQLTMDGWQIGFVQGVNYWLEGKQASPPKDDRADFRPDPWKGERDVMLFLFARLPIASSRWEKRLVARLHCQVLKNTERNKAFEFFNGNGTITQMRQDVIDVPGAAVGTFDRWCTKLKSQVFNLRYMPDDFQPCNEKLPPDKDFDGEYRYELWKPPQLMAKIT